MITLGSIREYISSLDITEDEYVYMGILDAKQERSLGVYNSKHQYNSHKALGGPDLEGYGEKYVTILVHWNKSPRDTEKVAVGLYEMLRRARDIQTEDGTIKFFQLLYDPQDIGTDDSGIYEWVIETAVIFEKKREGE